MKTEIAEYIQHEFDALMSIHPKHWLAQFHQIRGMLHAFAAIGEISDQELIENLHKLDMETIED